MKKIILNFGNSYKSEVKRLIKSIATLEEIVLRNETTRQAVENSLRSKIEKLESETESLRNRVKNLENIDYYKSRGVFEEMDSIRLLSNTNLSKALGVVDSVKETIRSTLAIAVDVNRNDRYNGSWAVVCFKVNGQTVIKHFDLQGDGNQIHKFLRQFAFAERRVDSPFKQYELLYKD